MAEIPQEREILRRIESNFDIGIKRFFVGRSNLLSNAAPKINAQPNIIFGVMVSCKNNAEKRNPNNDSMEMSIEAAVSLV